jgi:large subunit ribosomal protein L10
MHRDEKAAVIEAIAREMGAAEAIFAVDYRGISVKQSAELRGRLDDAGASFRVVKNRLTARAADQAGAESLKALLEGPTALTFVRGDAAVAAKELAAFRREHGLPEFKGGAMDGQPLTAADIDALSRLPARDVLYGQLVGITASPITGLVRTLNALVSGLAIQLGAIRDQGLVSGDAPAEESDGDAGAADSGGEAAEDGGGEASADDAADAASDDAGEAGAGEETGLSDGHAKAARPALEVRVMAQRQLCLGHAHRQAGEALRGELLDLLGRLGRDGDVARAVDAGGDGLDLLAHRGVVGIELREGVRLLAGLDDRLGQLGGARAAAGEAVVDLGGEAAGLHRQPSHQLHLLVGVAGPPVDRDHARHAELAHDPEVAAEVRGTRLQRGEALLLLDARIVFHAAVMLERPHRAHEHDGAR